MQLSALHVVTQPTQILISGIGQPIHNVEVNGKNVPRYAFMSVLDQEGKRVYVRACCRWGGV